VKEGLRSRTEDIRRHHDLMGGRDTRRTNTRDVNSGSLTPDSGCHGDSFCCHASFANSRSFCQPPLTFSMLNGSIVKAQALLCRHTLSPPGLSPLNRLSCVPPSYLAAVYLSPEESETWRFRISLRAQSLRSPGQLCPLPTV
jgi:hypothetical protein